MCKSWILMIELRKTFLKCNLNINFSVSNFKNFLITLFALQVGVMSELIWVIFAQMEKTSPPLLKSHKKLSWFWMLYVHARTQAHTYTHTHAQCFTPAHSIFIPESKEENKTDMFQCQTSHAEYHQKLRINPYQ